MRYRWLSMLFVLAAARLATPLAPTWNDMQVKHTWNAIPANWESLGHPPAETTIDLHFALKPHRENALIDALYEVSDPDLPKHVLLEQVADLVAPHPETLRLLNSWLQHGGVASPVSITHGGGWVTITDIPVSQANDLLGASYQLYRHTDANVTVLRTLSYALPTALHAHIQTISPTTCFSAPPRKLQKTPHRDSKEEAAAMVKAKATSGSTVTARTPSNLGVWPDFLRWLYNTEAYVPAATDRNVIGVAGYLDQSPTQEDLTTFMNIFRTDAMDATFTVLDVNGGGYNLSQPSDEASMNIQYAEGMVYPTTVLYYNIGGSVKWSSRTKKPKRGDADLEWLNFMLSISYGYEEQGLPPEYTRALCILFAQLGSRGVSVLASTGNDGVGHGDCDDGSGRVKFITFFPASCPWVTSVGGTTKYRPETAATLSGGGFSSQFPRPKYQDRAVSRFLQRFGHEYTDYYDSAGRGIPDISAQALQFNIVVDDVAFRVGGTSCSVPTVAGIVSLLNDYRLASGRSAFGFLNIWLYTYGFEGLNDITSGSNPGCNIDGFPAIIGWDPVTGLGTPDFVKLQQIINKGVVGNA
ncbi:subtilisin-like protein [Lactarius indigo]|nr:subtilisin-like protein [Lactarius indigo]